MARGPKFRVTHNPRAAKAKRYRYAIVAANGALLQSGEGYPTHQHVTRAVEALWAGLAASVLQQMDVPRAVGRVPVPYAKDSLKPDERAPAAKTGLASRRVAADPGVVG